jgi:D-alanine-D-alanine ligase
MRKKTIAFLYNVRHQYPDPNDPATQLETDFDDRATIVTMIKHLEALRFDVIPIEANRNAYTQLKRNREHIDLAFNYSLGMFGMDRYAHLPSMLEMLQIPYTGATPLGEALVLNKAYMKDILIANNIPTLPYQLFTAKDTRIKRRLKFPLIVKPVAQGSSAGITNDSVVWSEVRLREQIESTLALFPAGALVEPFITGREFSVGLLGNPPQVLPMVEADHSTLPDEYYPMDSLEVKWILEEEGGGESDHLICPAVLGAKLRKRIERICRRAWHDCGMQDFCRIDVRLDNASFPQVLDINSPCGLIPPEVSMTSYFPLEARAAGMNYRSLLRSIINAAFQRYGIK